jgi:hypothetical protein
MIIVRGGMARIKAIGALVGLVLQKAADRAR